ncbi:hydroxyacid dehydrogenase [bacterium]|nr:hydroxyacid dehydrogenase [bacterium]
MFNIVFLDADSLGMLDLSPIAEQGALMVYASSGALDLTERIKNCECVVASHVPIRAINMERARNLKLIVTIDSNITNIDMEYAKQNGIKVVGITGFAVNSIAQCTVAAMLNLVCKFHYFDKSVKSGAYSRSHSFTDSSQNFFDIVGKTWGIIGMGKIGNKVAEMATTLGMKIIYYPLRDEEPTGKYEAVSIEDLMRRSDVLSVHAPANSQTINLITNKMMKLMRPTACVMNFGGAGIINEEDLVQCLNDYTISGAASDTYTQEPLPFNHPYFQLNDPDKMILTPHISWASYESRVELVKMIAQEIKAFRTK